MYGGVMIGYEEKYSTIGALNVLAVIIIPPNSTVYSLTHGGFGE